MLKMLHNEFYMFKKLNTYLDYIEDTELPTHRVWKFSLPTLQKKELGKGKTNDFSWIRELRMQANCHHENLKTCKCRETQLNTVNWNRSPIVINW